MKYYLFLFSCIFFSCASQGSPNGGPIDDRGPQVVKISPTNNLILSSEDKIVIFFDELINPITIVNAIEIFPSNNFSYRISGKKIIISPENKWNNSTVLKIKLSRYISDYQNNFMSSPIELFYFNSSESSNKMISGKIINADNKLFELGLYEIKNLDYKLIEKTESNERDIFEFKYLNEGEYFIAAVSDSLVNIQDDIRKRKYGMITDSSIDLIKSDTIYIDIKIDSPIEQLSIKSFEQVNNGFGYIMYDNGKKEPFIIPKGKDSLLINFKLKNRLESYTVNYPIILRDVIDTISPMIKSFETFNNNIGEITLNEPIQHLDNQNNPIIFYLQDSIYHTLDYDFVNPFTITFSLDNKLISQILVSNLTDLYSNTVNDTLSVLVESSNTLENDIQGGNVYGSIIYKGDMPIIIKAESIDLNYTYYTFLDKISEFSIINIEPGFYTFSAFEFLGGYDSTQYFSGLWDPVSRAAKFSIYPDNLEIRKHWDIKDMIIEIK